jgi:hypothetical protein
MNKDGTLWHPSRFLSGRLLLKLQIFSYCGRIQSVQWDLHSRPGCHVVSKAFSISKDTPAFDISLLKLWRDPLETYTVSLVLWCATKPHWLAFSKFLSSMCLWAICRISFSKCLPVVDRTLVVRLVGGNLGFLPALAELWFWLPSKIPGSDRVESSDKIN